MGKTAFSKTSRSALWLTKPSIPWVPENFSVGAEWPERQTDHHNIHLVSSRGTHGKQYLTLPQTEYEHKSESISINVGDKFKTNQ
jgi:hypothetical protein